MTIYEAYHMDADEQRDKIHLGFFTHQQAVHDCLDESRKRFTKPVPTHGCREVKVFESFDDLTFRLPGQPELSFGIYAPGRFAWKLKNIRPLDKPLPHKGAQGLRTFQWPANNPV